MIDGEAAGIDDLVAVFSRVGIPSLGRRMSRLVEIVEFSLDDRVGQAEVPLRQISSRNARAENLAHLLDSEGDVLGIDVEGEAATLVAIVVDDVRLQRLVVEPPIDRAIRVDRVRVPDGLLAGVDPLAVRVEDAICKLHGNLGRGERGIAHLMGGAGGGDDGGVLVVLHTERIPHIQPLPTPSRRKS